MVHLQYHQEVARQAAARRIVRLGVVHYHRLAQICSSGMWRVAVGAYVTMMQRHALGTLCIAGLLRQQSKTVAHGRRLGRLGTPAAIPGCGRNSRPPHAGSCEAARL